MSQETTELPDPAVASALSPCDRLAQLQHEVDRFDVDPNLVLGELRMHLNAIELAPSLAGANLHRECVCELLLLLDRFITLGGQLPHPWHHAGGRR